MTEVVRSTLDNKNMAVVYFLIYKKPSILFITIFCSLNLNAMVSEEMPLDGLIHIYQIEPNMFQIMEPTLIV